MTAEPPPAGFALSAAKVDFADDTFTQQGFGSVANGADKLMPRHAAEPHVAFKDLYVGGTDTREVNFDERNLTVVEAWAAPCRPFYLRSSILDLRWNGRGCRIRGVKA